MSKLFEVLYLFTAPEGALVEVKRLDMPIDAAKSQVYQWLWIQPPRINLLHFVSMTMHPRQERIFQEAALSFDDESASLRWRYGSPISLCAEPPRTLSRSLQAMLNLHFT